MAKDNQIGLPAGTKVPDHIAMILDGNRRWARARGLKPWEGHYAGYKAIQELARASRSLGVHTFTIWAFSTENWERPREEVGAIMNLLGKAIEQAKKEAVEEKVRMVHIGRKDRLPADLARGIAELEELTSSYTGHTFNFAVDYGGHDEIVRAVNKILESGKREITIKDFEDYLDTAGQAFPYVDLFIRTSGEQRTSGLFPWQLDYAEYYFEPEHLPDFTPEKLREAVLDYSRRRRRFGGNDAQEHLKFDPKVVADLEIKWRHALALGQNERFRDLVIRYVREHYGLSKELARTAGLHLAAAVSEGKAEDWEEAKKALVGLYEIVQKTLKLAFEPEVVANIELSLWKGGQTEEEMRQLLAEKFRFSNFQAAKSARLAYLAGQEVAKSNWKKAKWYMERYYRALKERVA
jgi:undecaprenyl diphosphate synthase